MKNILVLHLFSSRLFSFRAPRNCVSIQILIIAIIIISQREYITRLLYPLMLHIFNPIMKIQLNILSMNKVHRTLKEFDIIFHLNSFVEEFFIITEHLTTIYIFSISITNIYSNHILFMQTRCMFCK